MGNREFSDLKERKCVRLMDGYLEFCHLITCWDFRRSYEVDNEENMLKIDRREQDEEPQSGLGPSEVSPRTARL